MAMQTKVRKTCSGIVVRDPKGSVYYDKDMRVVKIVKNLTPRKGNILPLRGALSG